MYDLATRAVVLLCKRSTHDKALAFQAGDRCKFTQMSSKKEFEDLVNSPA